MSVVGGSSLKLLTMRRTMRRGRYFAGMLLVTRVDDSDKAQAKHRFVCAIIHQPSQNGFH